jgi:hypothetical protein
MFPTIFALSIKELGPYTKLGPSLLVASILGGALWVAASNGTRLVYNADLTGNLDGRRDSFWGFEDVGFLRQPCGFRASA